MLIILLILIFIRPFISSLAFPYLNSVYSGLLLIFLIIWYIYKGISIKKIQAIKYPLILFFLALIISMIFSSDKLNSLKEIYKYISGLLLFLIAASLTSEEKMNLIQSIVLAGLVISLLAIYQYFFGFQHILNYITQQQNFEPFVLDYLSRKRVFFPFVTPNTLAGYLAMIIPLTLTHKDKIWFIIPISFALLLTKSLGALLSLFLGLSLYFLLQRKFEKRTILFLFGLLAIIGLIFMARLNTQKQHLQPIFSTVMRLNYWKDTLMIIKTSPLVGVGLGNFNLIHSRYAHNSYLQIWAEMGILGIASFLWMLISVIYLGVKEIKNFPFKNQISSIFIANIVFLIHNFIDFSFFLPEVSVIWWLILGLIIDRQ